MPEDNAQIIGCHYVWLGDEWSLVMSSCPPGQSCVIPADPGTEIGEERHTACSPIDAESPIDSPCSCCGDKKVKKK